MVNSGSCGAKRRRGGNYTLIFNRANVEGQNSETSIMFLLPSTLLTLLAPFVVSPRPPIFKGLVGCDSSALTLTLMIHIENGAQRSSKRAIERATDRASDRASERSSERSSDRAIERASDLNLIAKYIPPVDLIATYNPPVDLIANYPPSRPYRDV